MEKKEILNNLKPFIQAENELAIKEAKHLIKVFNALLNSEINEYENNLKTETNTSPIDPMKDNENIEILDLINKFNSKREKEIELNKEKESKNLSRKKSLLDDLKTLIQTKENIGTLISGIKSIREEWSGIGNVPSENHNEIQANFSKLNDEFNYNINIYKELKENDLKINYSLKNQIIHQLNELKNENNFKQLEKKLRSLQNKWEEIGPTFKEHWEELKSNYWTIIHLLYEKIKTHYKEQKTNQSENLKTKALLIEEVATLSKELPSTHKEWDKLTNSIMSIQEKWKSTGPVPKKENNKIWEEFRGYCDQFFNAKKEFYNERNQTQKKHADQKKSLINELEEVVKGKEFKEVVKEIKKLQEKWKKIGHAGKHIEQKLWHNFRSNCDAFFENKNKETKARIKEEEESLKIKISIVEQIKDLDIKSDSNKEKLYDLIEKYKSTGKTAYNKSKTIFNEFQDIILKKLKDLKVTIKEKEELLTLLKIIQINDSFNPEKTLQIERDKIKKKINQTMKEVLNYENNLGFFNNSSGNSSILNTVNSNIEKGKKEIEKLKAELKKLKL